MKTLLAAELADFLEKSACYVRKESRIRGSSAYTLIGPELDFLIAEGLREFGWLGQSRLVTGDVTRVGVAPRHFAVAGAGAEPVDGGDASRAAGLR